MHCFVSTLCFINILLIPSGNGHLMADRLRWDFLHLEDKLWQYVLEQSRYGFNDTEDPGIEIIGVFQNFDLDLQKVPQDILYGMEVIRQAPPFLFLYSDLRLISDMYDKFRSFLIAASSGDSNNITVVDDIETRMSHIIEEVLNDPKNNVNKTVTNIFKGTFNHNENSNLMSDVFDIISSNNYICKNFQQSPQQVFYNLYNAITLAELKGYIMIQFAYMAEKLKNGHGSYVSDSLRARKQFEKITNDTALTLWSIMRITQGDLWRCDPKQHAKGTTYDELTALIQGHIENEVDMNGRGTCKENCAAYPYAESYGCFDGNSDYCRRRKTCSGKILNCRFVESHMTACISNWNSPRRYEYIQYDSGKVLGKKQRCENRKINSWFRWFVHCSYCLCLCDQQGLHSDRYFNLRPVIADVANNRVVTGIRIVKHNRLIHLQIQEGKLLPYGYIDDSTVRWVPVDDYRITDYAVKSGVDYYTMDYRNRALSLDDLEIQEKNQIITGVRFEVINGRLKFEVNVRDFNFENGSLSEESYYIHGGQNWDRIDVSDSDIPTASPQSKPNFDSDQYIEFTHTSFERDAAQTTVPYFDTQPVETHPAVPLKGAGLYFKGTRGYGGFVAPKITTYDFAKHAKVDFPRVLQRDDAGSDTPTIA